MQFEYLTYSKESHIVTLTLNRPERLNSISPPMNLELWEALNTFREDKDAWVCILTGAGDRAFCAGNDLRYTAENWGEREKEAATGARIRAAFGGITTDMDFKCWIPIIAAVNGYALGGGLELAMACDIIVIADHAEVGLPEPRVGLIAGAGGVHRLPRHVPLKRAMGMMLTARRISAQEAYDLGLVNEIVPLSEVVPTAKKWANEILEAAPLSVRASKQMAYEGLDWPLSNALQRRYSEENKFLGSADMREGPLAFSEMRKPNWIGA